MGGMGGSGGVPDSSWGLIYAPSSQPPQPLLSPLPLIGEILLVLWVGLKTFCDICHGVWGRDLRGVETTTPTINYKFLSSTLLNQHPHW